MAVTDDEQPGLPDPDDDWADDADATWNGSGLAPTQPLPTVVRREGLGAPTVAGGPASLAAADAQPVRAVARRVPSALPALGRDEITDVPASARANADRRRRAREAAAQADTDHDLGE